MRDAPGQLAEILQALRLLQLCLQPFFPLKGVAARGVGGHLAAFLSAAGCTAPSLTPRLIPALLSADLPRHRGYTGDRTCRAEDWCRGYRDRDHRQVLADPVGFVPLYAPGCDDPLQDRGLIASSLGRAQHIRREADDLLCRVAIEDCRSLIPAAHDAGQSYVDDCVLRLGRRGRPLPSGDGPPSPQRPDHMNHPRASRKVRTVPGRRSSRTTDRNPRQRVVPRAECQRAGQDGLGACRPVRELSVRIVT